MASSSSDQGATPYSHFKYDVFLSFKGYTRLRFTDALYHALVNKRIETFRDSEKLRIGQELEGALLEAIERSRMSILILCDEYPTSKWCLDELVKIMECSHNGTKRPVLPVYYYVTKSDVQYQLNEYAKAMIDHQNKGRYNHKLKAWRSALSQVGKIYGQRCNQNTPWGMALDNIVEEVTKRLPPMPLCIDRPLGCDSELEEAKSLLEIDSRATCLMLGIHGDGELSKFVAELYNKIRPHFVTASFLSNMSEKTNESGGGLEDLQETLLSEMGEEIKTKIGSTFKGSSEIKQRLGQKRVLLVLDDVDNIKQLKSLAGGIDWFGPGSRIIITTRYEDVLDEHVLNNGIEVKKYCYDEGEFDGNKGSYTMMEENIVGLQKDFDEVINQLKEEDSPRNVVSIVCMGGLGKTTLARKIYNSKEVRKLFPCRAWTTVSKEYMEKEVFRNLLNSLTSQKSKYENLREEELKEKVRKCLNGKKYLVVLDDVWETEAWDKLKDYLPDNKNGSMILITTRKNHVAYYARSKDPHHQQNFLDKDQSWEMFRNKVFGREECPHHLEPIGRSIAESCKGLPLAVKTIAGIVSKRERSEDAWEKIKNLLPYWSVFEDKEGVKLMQILKLSYDDLPEKMKPCFLYLGVYPEDCKIRVRDLIELWIVEGFIQPPEHTRMRSKALQPEDIGEQYLKELVDRNLVQVIHRKSDGESVRTCQIHDLIRELCITESARNINARKLSFSCNARSYTCSATCNESRTCSLFFFGDPENWSSHIPPEESFRVHVLYFSTSFLYKEGEEENIKNLLHLRYLRVRLSFTTNLLPTLDKLETLRILDNPLEIVDIRFGIEQLNYVRSVTGVKLLADTRRRMQNLRTLYHVCLDSEAEFLLNNGYFPNLTSLGLNLSSFRKKTMKPLSLHCPKSVNKLKLCYYNPENFSLDAIVFPPNLTKISLLCTNELNYGVMNALGRIASLRVLKLCGGLSSDETLHLGGAGSFPQLKVFIMRAVSVSYLTMEEGAMPRLRRVFIRECFELE
ncbi:disease resistance protein RPP13-like [Arachis stenosperma]|uniref:disease resistance protein RPP13-like n=1 Tax=Arachis stenosperma TaxID=217475 RepID=UPI0025ABC736|nr:disease resistance protein RPP13-like [Arachis stenosperma]